MLACHWLGTEGMIELIFYYKEYEDFSFNASDSEVLLLLSCIYSIREKACMNRKEGMNGVRHATLK